jgi:hypothetical protein
VALYGHTYCEAGRQVVELLSHRGLDVVINDDLSGAVMLLSSICSGLLGFLFTLLIASAKMNIGEVHNVQ